jgi:type IV pilus assembly protein PilY1
MALTGASTIAGTTDISNTPLANTSDISAKPNIMFIIDDSGSMGSDYMPDDVGDSGAYGYKSAQCNGVAYNPNFNYSGNLPMQADGTTYPHASFTAAMSDGFDMSLTGTTRTSSTSVTMGTGDLTFVLSGTPYSTTTGATIAVRSTSDVTTWMVGTIKSWNSTSKSLTVTVTGVAGSGTYSAWTIGKPSTTDLSNSTYYKYTGTQAALSWVYTASGPTQNTFYNECMSSVGNSPGSSVFTAVTMTSSSTDAQNYADWYSYFRMRYLMMRTVSGQAFSSLTDKYRVGYTSISYSGIDSTTTKFLDVSDFDSTQKNSFYKKIYTVVPSSSTPLRGALSKVGRYYANKISGQTYDPIQYACQRNYTLMSTDGYWNTGSESTTYTALQMDGTTTVGQQDGSEAKPMWDGQKAKVTTTTPYSTTIHQTATYTRSYTYNVTGATYTVWSSTGCSGSKKKLTTYTGVKGTEIDTASATDYEDVSGTTTQTVVTLDGVVQSTTYSTPTATGSPSVTSSSVGSATLSSFSMTSYTGSSTGSCVTTSTTASAVSGGTKTLSSTSDGSKTRTVTSQTPIAATGSSTITSTTYSGGASNTLADVAEYYYATDLRTSALGNCTGAKGVDVCDNEVPPADRDKASWQHMTTFTMGLGVGGTLIYDRNYLSQTSGDYYNLTQGTVSWPAPSVTTNGGDPTNVDDLWHAAVNGRGQYFATTDPTTLADAITTVLTSVKKATGSSSAAATSNLRLVSGGDNIAYQPQYETVTWVGNIVAYSVDATTGALDTANPLWKAQDKVDGVSPSTRTVYYLKPGGGTPTLQSFNYTNLSSDGYTSYFANMCSRSAIPAQCSSLTAAQKNIANSGTNLVSYLLGDRTYESYTDTSTSPASTVAIYRARTHLLGDIVNAAPVFVGKPPFSYADAGYTDFVTAKANRQSMVYVAANDGMLHALKGDKTGGSEVWAYVPSFVMSNLYHLADTNYANDHHYYVDGSPVVGDIYVSKAWKSILVGGLNSGGKGFYAIDVTDPLNPKALWEFTDANMGYTYGNPIITKRADGTWVVVVSSGYNNTSGDGNGHLYVLNANTGALLKDIPTYTSGTTPAGSASTPSGLAKLNAWIEDSTDNTSLRFYGGDMLGNLWRFDIDGLLAPKNASLLLANFTVGTTPQPITVRPETADVTYGSNTYPVISVATGRYLGTSDIADKTTQSIYTIKDPLTSTGYGNVRARSDIVQQTLTTTTVSSGANAGQKIRTSSNNAVDWNTNIGWYMDLPSSGERVATDMVLQYSTLVVLSAIPGTDECRPSGGSAWQYYLDLTTGGSLSNAPDGEAGAFLGDFLGVGMTWILTSTGKSVVLTSGSTGDIVNTYPPTTSSGSGGKARRTSWRELAN